MDAATEKLCRSCHGCQVVGELCGPEPMYRVEPPTGPWQDVCWLSWTTTVVSMRLVYYSRRLWIK